MGKKTVTLADELEQKTAETPQETAQETAEAMEASEAALEGQETPASPGAGEETGFFANGQPVEPPQEVPENGREDDAEDQAEPWAAPPVTLAVVDAKRGLNLRTGPGKDFPVLAVLPDAALVEEIPLLANPSDEPAYLLQVPGWALVKPAASVGTASLGPEELADETGVCSAGWVDRNFLVPVPMPAYDGDDR